MVDLLKNAVQRLGQVLGTHLVQSVTFRRGTDSVVLNATIGTSAFEELDEFGVLHHINTRDYIINPADLVLGGSITEPRDGDLIEEVDDDAGVTRTYQVMPIGSNPGWRYSDRYRTLIRLHTKLIQTVPTP